MENNKNSYVISMSDIETHPYYDKYKDKGDEGLKMLLTLMGMDIHKNIERSFHTHRSDITGEVVKCDRFVGAERRDQAWRLLKIEASGALI